VTALSSRFFWLTVVRKAPPPKKSDTHVPSDLES
jgi:hypothetical protein